MKQEPAVCITLPPDDEVQLFRLGAADDILRLLVDAHETEFTIAELEDATGASRATVWRAVDLLADVGVVSVRKTTQRNYVSIDVDRLQKDDPYLAIEQSEFHEPVRAFVDEVASAIAETDAVSELVGVVIFGSVARGTADRASDVDCFVVVEGDRTAARRAVTEVAGDLRERRFDGDRYDFEPYVESVESASRTGSKLETIFEEGITVSGGNRLQSLRKEVLSDE